MVVGVEAETAHKPQVSFATPAWEQTSSHVNRTWWPIKGVIRVYKGHGCIVLIRKLALMPCPAVTSGSGEEQVRRYK